MTIQQREGFCFSFDDAICHQCQGYCCCGESGHVWLNWHEMTRIYTFLAINQIDFEQQYLHFVNGRWSIKEKRVGTEFHCVFFSTCQNGCTIYSVRPEQCRLFPFWPVYLTDYEAAAAVCPGVLPLVKSSR